ncbi:putative phospholipase B-like 2 isoform X1 [Dermacentor albipictus]|uniref:putative phospholipase B-like 2 isoform X1 n=1 Tax=Dermacentor albipictus TaxID=60249 RepID=UPI0031FD36F0
MRTLGFLLAFSLVSGNDLNDCRCAWLGLDQQQQLAIYQGRPPETPSDGAVVPAAWACFQNRIYEEGWSYLEVETNPEVEDGIQAYAAGALEADLTRQLMENHWLNMFGGYCRGNRLYCNRLRRFFDAYLSFSQGMQDLHRETDSYWRMVDLQMTQLAGLNDVFENQQLNYKNRLTRTSRVLLLSAMGDLMELEVKFGRLKDPHSLMALTCSALIKIAPGNKDIYFAHTSWFTYRSMLRMQKKYKLPWHTAAQSNMTGRIVPGHTITMSSYPGCLNSFDDFHLTSAGLAVMETSLKNTNHQLLRYVRPNGGPLTWVRNMVASRLSTSGSQWAAIFSRLNSGTYNNQWMVLDYKLFMPWGSLQPGTLWIVEQLPGIMESADITTVLQKQGYWASYNEAYLPAIALETRPPGWERARNHYALSPRAHTVRVMHEHATDMDAMKAFMRFTVQSGVCPLPCNYSQPIRDEVASMCPRFDLLPRGPSGGTDTKITNSGLFESLEFEAASGPTAQGVPPFSWHRSPFRAVAAHYGQPDTWRFGFVRHHWGHCSIPNDWLF